MNKNIRQMVIIILLVVNLIFTISFVVVPTVSAATGCFPDTNGHWAEEFICWLSDNGIAGGYPDGTFRPENQVTRAEMAVLMKNLSDSYESRITELETLLASVSLENSGQDFVFTGVNVHVRSGSGATDGTINGRGNLIVGYNEDTSPYEARTGSHNLVLGDENEYISYGGLVAGYGNTISGPYTSVSGGKNNIASGIMSSVSGGYQNSASGGASSVSGGESRSVSGPSDWRAGTLFESY